MKGKRRGRDFIIISFSASQQLYPLRGEVSGSMPHLQGYAASKRILYNYSPSLRRRAKLARACPIADLYCVNALSFLIYHPFYAILLACFRKNCDNNH